MRPRRMARLSSIVSQSRTSNLGKQGPARAVLLRIESHRAGCPECSSGRSSAPGRDQLLRTHRQVFQSHKPAKPWRRSRYKPHIGPAYRWHIARMLTRPVRFSVRSCRRLPRIPGRSFVRPIWFPFFIRRYPENGWPGSEPLAPTVKFDFLRRGAWCRRATTTLTAIWGAWFLGSCSHLAAQGYDAPMPAQASFVGLCQDTNDASFDHTGFLTMAVNGKGRFTAKLKLAGKSYGMAGQFSSDGTFSNGVPRRALEPLSVRLQLGSADADQI